MQKVYALLLAELRKLGATIVFADFSRIIIATGKFQVPAAQGYCEYLLKTIKTRYVTCGFISILWQLLLWDCCLVRPKLFENSLSGGSKTSLGKAARGCKE
jgi:hypothetical protein